MDFSSRLAHCVEHLAGRFDDRGSSADTKNPPAADVLGFIASHQKRPRGEPTVLQREGGDVSAIPGQPRLTSTSKRLPWGYES